MQTYPSAVLLDMDGTLLDSESLYKELWQKTAREFDIDLNDAVYAQFIGARYDQCLKMIQKLGGARFHLPDFLKALSRYEKGVLPPAKPGALPFIDWLEEKGIPKAVVTSSGSAKTEQNLKILGGRERFQAVIAGNDVVHPKPSPEPYLLACEQLGFSPEVTMAIEDSPTGARSAIVAGCQTVVVPDVLPIQKTIQEQSLVVLKSLALLPEWIDKHLSTNS
ncbi:HAD family hydrolase [Sansalvadorimonas verongulae]|uniref:HAD family hydrolase n=1 Tax=Sansalvadorimonas verongulae TaxID=2172824 RepID=UPI0012BC94D0|nr:HAD family phosphatase [Sansalvadorimonas verongulae]MTI15021.1 HAD family phosphatase [Sansalvadorimonas verongulae]